MKKSSLLLGLFLILVLSGCSWWGDEKIDVTDTDFDYDVEICDRYFELVGCIIDKDTNENYNKQMRIDLKKEVKQKQEEWKQLDEEKLRNRCTEELAKYEELKDNLNSFGCYLK